MRQKIHSIVEYFNDPNNFTAEQWERIQTRQILAGVKVARENKKEVVNKFSEKEKTKARKGKTLAGRKKWLPM